MLGHTQANTMAHVTSLEVFDNQGNQIAQMYGQRTEGTRARAMAPTSHRITTHLKLGNLL